MRPWLLPPSAAGASAKLTSSDPPEIDTRWFSGRVLVSLPLRVVRILVKPLTPSSGRREGLWRALRSSTSLSAALLLVASRGRVRRRAAEAPGPGASVIGQVVLHTDDGLFEVDQRTPEQWSSKMARGPSLGGSHQGLGGHGVGL